jgi:hypothetical protein
MDVNQMDMSSTIAITHHAAIPGIFGKARMRITLGIAKPKDAAGNTRKGIAFTHKRFSIV